MNNIIENKVNNYNDMNYKSSPVRYNDYISDKYNIVHEKLYVSALNKYIESNLDGYVDINSYKHSHSFMELKQKEYYKPSKVIIKTLLLNEEQTNSDDLYKFKKIDLTQYWDEYQFKDEYRDVNDIFINEDNINDYEIIYIDYVKGKVKYRSKYSGIEFYADFKYVNDESKYDETQTTLKDTFTYKLQNKIYGK